MKASLGYIAVAVAAVLIGVLPIIGGADTTPAMAASGSDPAIQTDAAPADQPQAEEPRARSNSPHPVEQSFKHPVYPIGVPLPPVSLERY